MQAILTNKLLYVILAETVVPIPFSAIAEQSQAIVHGDGLVVFVENLHFLPYHHRPDVSVHDLVLLVNVDQQD